MLTVRYDEIVKAGGHRELPRRHESTRKKLAGSSRSSGLAEFLAAIVADEVEAVRLVRTASEIAQARVSAERLVKEIPHQLYPAARTATSRELEGNLVDEPLPDRRAEVTRNLHLRNFIETRCAHRRAIVTR
jgi:hypothetical protein